MFFSCTYFSLSDAILVSDDLLNMFFFQASSEVKLFFAPFRFFLFLHFFYLHIFIYFFFLPGWPSLLFFSVLLFFLCISQPGTWILGLGSFSASKLGELLASNFCRRDPVITTCHLPALAFLVRQDSRVWGGVCGMPGVLSARGSPLSPLWHSYPSSM